MAETALKVKFSFSLHFVAAVVTPNIFLSLQRGRNGPLRYCSHRRVTTRVFTTLLGVIRQRIVLIIDVQGYKNNPLLYIFPVMIL